MDIIDHWEKLQHLRSYIGKLVMLVGPNFPEKGGIVIDVQPVLLELIVKFYGENKPQLVSEEFIKLVFI